jgi:hypothetical protein
VAERLPRNARRFPQAAESARAAFARLERFHGIKPELASDRLHDIKSKLGYSANTNLVFDFTGNVYDPDTLEWVGSLTEGGAK